ncbi:hypothetical protein [Microbacterium paludicola]|uniref:hypothetical protein n=1 Tax=Microbacterium paludicola TaxID=300019 RepID=UPI0031E2148B
MTDYPYTKLKAALEDRNSPLRQLLDERLPNTRQIQSAYRTSAGPLLVDGGSANAGTVGTAFDLMTRFRLEPMHDAGIARMAFLGEPAIVAEIDAVIVTAQVAGGVGDNEGLARASWALALLEEVFRAGLWPGSPLAEMLEAGRCTAQALLELASDDALRQLTQLDMFAASALLPHLDRPLVIGPTFDGSVLCSADADVIAGDLLVDLKTKLGAKNSRTGERADQLDLLQLRQVVSYALFDRSDSFQIRRVGLYSARYGHLAIWSLGTLLDTLADAHVDLQALREDVWRALGGR